MSQAPKQYPINLNSVHGVAAAVAAADAPASGDAKQTAAFVSSGDAPAAVHAFPLAAHTADLDGAVVHIPFVDAESIAFARLMLADPTNPVTDAASFQRAVSGFMKRFAHIRKRVVNDGVLPTPGLKAAIDKFTLFIRAIESSGTGGRVAVRLNAGIDKATAAAIEPFDFYRDLLPSIITYALNDRDAVSIPYLEIRFLLANSFFGNISSVNSPYQKAAILKQNDSQFPGARLAQMGDMSWDRLNQSTITESIERLICQLSYFYQITFIPAYAKTFAPLTASPNPKADAKPADAKPDAKADGKAGGKADGDAKSQTAATATAAAAVVAPAPFVEGRVTYSRFRLATSGVPIPGTEAKPAPKATAADDMQGDPVPSLLPKWTSSTRTIIDAVNRTRIHTDSMEASDAPVFVNFANRFLHIGSIIPSLTQEEVLFSAAPEHFPGILFCEVMDDDECILIQNARRFNDYSGYLSTFKFTGLYTHPKLYDPNASVATFDSVAIDSVMSQHFHPKAIVRDLDKAYLGWLVSARGRQSTAAASPAIDQKSTEPIASASAAASAASGTAADSKQTAVAAGAAAVIKLSTGNWGCGAFGGDKHLKFLQQLMAAELAGVALDYSTFKDDKLCLSLKELGALAVSSRVTIAQLVDAFERAPPSYSTDFGAWIKAQLRKVNNPPVTASAEAAKK